MIKVQSLFKKFNDQVVLNNINLEIKRGELLVILGESGSGKSVFLQHLIGILKPDRGTIEIEGADITKFSEKQLLRIRKNMGYLFQEGALYDFMTVYENVAFPVVEHMDLKPHEIKKKVDDVLNIVGLKEAADKYPAKLSGGMKKRAALARSIILDSKILFCDEPTSGLDPIKSREISDLIQDIARQSKSTTVVTSHDVVNSLRIADRVVLIHQGAIVTQVTPGEFKLSQNPIVKRFLT